MITNHIALSILNELLSVLSEVSASRVHLHVPSFIQKCPVLRTFELPLLWLLPSIIALSRSVVKMPHLSIGVPVMARVKPCRRRLFREGLVSDWGRAAVGSFLRLLVSRYKERGVSLRALYVGFTLSDLIFRCFSSGYRISKVYSGLWQGMTLFHRVPWQAGSFRHFLMFSYICSQICLNCRLDVLYQRNWSWGIHRTQIIFRGC
jgi:hypothetical protein